MPEQKSLSIKKRPTLRTIASITGLAVTTVSRALSNAPEIAISTRERVAKVADEIGYVPDRAAQRLRTGRTNVISFLLSPHEELLGFSNSITLGLTQAMRGTNFNLIITPSYEESNELKTIESIVRNKMADGIVFSRTEPQDERVQLLLENNFPFVCHGRTELTTPHLHLDYDNDAFAQIAVKRLAEKGRKNLVAIMPDEKFTFHKHLKQGFTSTAAALGINCHVPKNVNLDDPPERIYEVIANLLTSDTPPDGFVCAGEVVAMITMACLSDHHRKLTIHADIVTKQTTALYDHIRPKVDTIFEDITLAGKEMGQLLIEKIQNKETNISSIIQNPEIRFLEPFTK